MKGVDDFFEMDNCSENLEVKKLSKNFDIPNMDKSFCIPNNKKKFYTIRYWRRCFRILNAQYLFTQMQEYNRK